MTSRRDWLFKVRKKRWRLWMKSLTNKTSLIFFMCMLNASMHLCMRKNNNTKKFPTIHIARTWQKDPCIIQISKKKNNYHEGHLSGWLVWDNDDGNCANPPTMPSIALQGKYWSFLLIVAFQCWMIAFARYTCIVDFGSRIGKT